ncbi:SHOCT domain-containing protein [Streptomyces sp. NBC_01317]|uniref:SHOCT domain-containing protein n=1 Tax=Streptomyces sp. NBC_01317 TaxID=2903822 RepID=UPI002E103214|nr:SHOCT domain-containing protein [Streptomyces sp. NBC_01317]
MNTLALHGGPGPWILFLPVVWAAVIVTAVTVLRRTVWRGRGIGPRGPWRAAGAGRVGPGGEPAHDAHSPIALLGRRFATGEIDEDEYWRRLSVLDEQFGRTVKGAGL